MVSRSFLAAASAVHFFGSFVTAQSTGNVSVPPDLSGGFQPDDTTLQVSFTNQSDNGFPDGSNIPLDSVGQTPTFALGDSSGINTEISYVIFMVDTTDDNSRVLHYVHSNFKATEQKTAIASSSDPELAWQAPGSLDDTGAGRAYTFLLYEQKGQFPNKSMPALGQNVSVPDFAQANRLAKAVAGIAMQVDVSSTSANASTSTSPAVLGNESGNAEGAQTSTDSGASASAPAQASTTDGADQGAAAAVAAGTAAAVASSTTVASVASGATTAATVASGSTAASGTSAGGAATTSAVPGAAGKQYASWGITICAGVLVFAGGMAM